VTFLTIDLFYQNWNAMWSDASYSVKEFHGELKRQTRHVRKSGAYNYNFQNSSRVKPLQPQPQQ
jgi:hypothetical protein